jgi:hypothetical protein
MGVVEAINDLANIYPAGGNVIVTEILSQPRAECQHSKAIYETWLSAPVQN